MVRPSPAAHSVTRLGPLYAAGFVTAFGAHSVAAGLGVSSADDPGQVLLRLGVLLALYDLAEVILKPVFGSLSDRIGAKPVILGGLVGFAVLSLLGLAAGDPLFLAAARLGQGAAAAAFSPASSATVARLAGGSRQGRYFGRYGSWKGLGYTLGPLLGAGLIAAGGLPLLFLVLSASAAGTALWVLVALPAPPPLPRPRYTLVDLARQTADPRFLIPTLALAASTGVLGAAIGFLPLLAARTGLPVFASIAIVSLLALTSSLVQPWVGTRRDRRGGDDGDSGSGSGDGSGDRSAERSGVPAHVDRVLADGVPAHEDRVLAERRPTRFDRTGTVTGLAVTAVGVLLAAALPVPVMLYAAAVLIGIGIGITTPLAFAALADSTPPERMGRTMGSAELGRELGDSAGPLLVGAVGAAVSLPLGLGALGVAAGAAAVLVAVSGRR